MELSVEARILCHSLGVFGMFKQVELSDLLAYNTTDGNYGATRERMTDAWHEYQKAMPQLRCPFRSALTFLASPTWKDSRLWSWAETPRFEPGVQEKRETSLEETNRLRAQFGWKPLEAL